MKLSSDQRLMVIWGGVVLMLTCTYWFTHSFQIRVGSPQAREPRRIMRVVSLNDPNEKLPVFDEAAQITALRQYAGLHFGDPDAELLTITEPVVAKAQIWRLVKFRAKNSFGAPVINEFMATFEGNELLRLADDDDFSKVPGDNQEESRTFMKALASAHTLDVRLKK